jgi:formate hydrogenlyase transcriptional activator
VIERAVILTSGPELGLPPIEIAATPLSRRQKGSTAIRTLADAERALITEALLRKNWVVSGPRGAAAELGLKRTTLSAMMQRLGISRSCEVVEGRA